MVKILRKLEDADVEVILEEVALSASCDVATLKDEINWLVAVSGKPRLPRNQAISAIHDLLSALEQLQNVLQRCPPRESLVATMTLGDAWRDSFFSNLPITARSPENPVLRGTHGPTFGDQLAQLIDYYTALRAERKALKGRPGPPHDFFVLGLRPSLNAVSIGARHRLREGPFCYFLSAVLTRCGRRMGPDGAHKLLGEVLDRKRSRLTTLERAPS